MTRNLGTINGYVQSVAFKGRKRFTFDGTTLGLTVAAVAAGAKAGDIVRADFGGDGRDARPMRIDAAPHDDRAVGFWATRIIR